MAGPAVNVAIAAVLFGWLWLARAFEPVHELTVADGSLLERLLVVNIFLVLFNMLPAFPMDGGRVLRALLAMRLGRRRAGYRRQYRPGHGDPLRHPRLLLQSVLVFIAIFVFLGAQAEASAVEMQSALDGSGSETE